MTEIKGLGYVRVQATDMERWSELGFDVLGFAPGTGPEDDALHFRMDERPARITVEPGDADRVTAVGWEVRDAAALRRLTDRLDFAGCEYAPMPFDTCEKRRVEGGLIDDGSGWHPTRVLLRPGARPQSGHHPLRTEVRHRTSGPGPRGDADDRFRPVVPLLHRGAGIPSAWRLPDADPSGSRTDADPLPRGQPAAPQSGDHAVPSKDAIRD